MKKRSIVCLLMMALVLVLGCSQNGSAQTAKPNPSASKTEEKAKTDKKAASPASAAEAKTVTVTAEGYGETLDAAKKDALHSAVQEVVGTLVDAETQARNDELIQDVLTASNGVVTSHKVKSVKKEDGFFHVTIQAVVVRTVLSERLQAVLKTTKKLDGASMAGMVETKMKSEDDGAKMLAKFLVEENFPYSCLKFEVEEAKVVKTADVCSLEAKATISCDQAKYKEFSKKLVKLLDKIAVKKLQEGLVAERNDDYHYASTVKITMENVSSGSNICFVNTSSIRGMERTVWNVYLLSPKAAAVLRLYEEQCAKVELKLLDKDGELLDVKQYDNITSVNGDNTSFHLMNGCQRGINNGNSFHPFAAYLYSYDNINNIYAASRDFFTFQLSVSKADLGRLDRQESRIIPPLTGEEILARVDAILKEIDSKR